VSVRKCVSPRIFRRRRPVVQEKTTENVGLHVARTGFGSVVAGFS
jgi:hypothetical protein